jgi:hypothetical protein
MKKILLTLSFSLLITVAFSQAKVEIGLKGGLNSSTQQVDDPSLVVNSATAFHAGLYGLIKITKFGIQPEILYSPQKNEQVQGGTVTKQTNVYLDIPIMMKLYLAAGVNIQAGPQFGILTSAEEAGATNEDDLKNSDLSIAVGAGWDAPFGLQANVRYIIGLSDINDDKAAIQGAIKNRTLQFSLGYRIFKVGK